MKKSIVILILLSGCTWSTKTKIAYTSMMATQAVDFAQTYKFINDPNDGIEELNPLISDTESLILVAAVSNVILLIVPEKIMTDQQKQNLFWFVSGIHLGCAINNYHIGVRF